MTNELTKERIDLAKSALSNISGFEDELETIKAALELADKALSKQGLVEDIKIDFWGDKTLSPFAVPTAVNNLNTNRYELVEKNEPEPMENMPRKIYANYCWEAQWWSESKDDASYETKDKNSGIPTEYVRSDLYEAEKNKVTALYQNCVSMGETNQQLIKRIKELEFSKGYRNDQ
jgi:hypothetical protein